MRFAFSLLGTLLITSSVVANPLERRRWQDLESEKSYTLTQSIHLVPEFKLPQGQRLELRELGPLPGLAVTSFSLYLSACPWPDGKSEMTLVLAAGASAGSEVGVELNSCAVEIYVENKDLPTLSFFE